MQGVFHFLAKNLGFGVYNVHTGFDPLYIDQVVQTLKDNGIAVSPFIMTVPVSWLHWISSRTAWKNGAGIKATAPFSTRRLSAFLYL